MGACEIEYPFCVGKESMHWYINAAMHPFYSMRMCKVVYTFGHATCTHRINSFFFREKTFLMNFMVMI